jgi:aminoglycoside 6'-N-acetyltransferase
MIPKSGNRFSDKIMVKQERVPSQSHRDGTGSNPR